jgi:sugar-specific transcriptional regulator TrmB
MHNNMYLQELQEFGLSEKEAKVYLALLELEVATVQEVAKCADVNRSTAYVVLEALKKRGLVSVSADKQIQKYVVSPPDRLLRIAEQDAKERLNIRHRINAILPDLKSLYKGTKQKPRIQIFEGPENIVTSIGNSLNGKEKIIRVYSAGSRMFRTLSEYMPVYMERRTKAGIKMFGIHPDDPENDLLKKLAPPIDESVFIPPEKYHFTADICIFDSTIIYVSHEGEYSIQIENGDLADAMKSAFDLAFEGAKNIASPKRQVNRRRTSSPSPPPRRRR